MMVTGKTPPMEVKDSLVGRIMVEKSHAYAVYRRLRKRRELVERQVRPTLTHAKHVAIMVVRNEADLLPDFLAHHRALGFDHFVVVDNNSTDDTFEVLRHEHDVSYLWTNGSYKDSRFGNDWANYVASRWCLGKWVLFADADERLVYPHCDVADIATLTKHLQRTGQISLVCLMIDMYSDKPVHQNVYPPGAAPLTVCNLYDRYGYFRGVDEPYATTWVKGGVRCRAFFADDPWAGPALNKTPLIRWGHRSAFIRSSHTALPRRANIAGPITGALLHFKFLARIQDKVAVEAVSRQHTDEYQRYSGIGLASFVGEESGRYDNWKSLSGDGLICGEEWILNKP
jgi:hypothetical protein